MSKSTKIELSKAVYANIYPTYEKIILYSKKITPYFSWDAKLYKTYKSTHLKKIKILELSNKLLHKLRNYMSHSIHNIATFTNQNSSFGKLLSMTIRTKELIDEHFNLLGGKGKDIILLFLEQYSIQSYFLNAIENYSSSSIISNNRI